MTKKLIVFLSILSLTLSLPLIPANAAVKSGASCKTLGITSVASGKTYTCIKSGKKLVWNKGVLNKSSKAVANDVYINPSDSSDNVELCKIKEVNLNGPRNGNAGPGGASIKLASGFPSVTPSTKNMGTVKWAVIPIDFPDLKGEANFNSRIDSQMAMLSDWYNTVSEGKFKVEWVVAKNWITLAGTTNNYEIGLSANLGNSTNGQKLFKDAMKAADPTFNFTGIQTVNFLLPKSQKFITETSQGFPWDSAVIDLVTNEGSISSYSIAGVFMDQPNKDYWGYWAHEFGHAISLPHIGASRGPGPLIGGYDLMAYQDGPTRDLTGWLRFVAQWLPDEKVYCKEFQRVNNTEVTLVPINSSQPGFKMVVVPLSDTKAVIIESRRESKFNCKITPIQNGVLAYVYDANLSHGEDFLIPISPDGRQAVSTPCPTPQMKDSLLRTGDKVIFDGLVIENISHGNFDRIKISKKI